MWTFVSSSNGNYRAALGLVVTDDDGGVGVAVAAPWPGGPVVAGGAPAQLEAVPVSRLPPPDPAVAVLAPDAHLGNIALYIV